LRPGCRTRRFVRSSKASGAAPPEWSAVGNASLVSVGDAVHGGGGGEDLVKAGGVDGAVEPEIQERQVRAGGDALTGFLRQREAAALHQAQQLLGLSSQASLLEPLLEPLLETFLEAFFQPCEAGVAHDGASPGGERCFHQ